MSNAYYMPLSALSDDQLRKHQEALTMVPADTFAGRGDAKAFDVYTKTPTHLLMPRFYGLDHFGPPAVDRTWRGVRMARGVEFCGELSDEQRNVVCRVDERFRVDDDDAAAAPFPRGGILVLPCGWGKTVAALYVAAVVVRRKCIILVHKQGLMEQWCERVRQFLPSVSVGVLRQDNIDVEADILVAMIQTVARRNYSGELQDRGLVIVDECHHLGAPVFGSAMAKLSCSWCLGLSATPTRKDGLTTLLYMTMGPILCRIEREKETAFVTSLLFDEKATHHEVLRNGRPVYVAMVNRLAADARRNAALAMHIARLQRGGRNILVLSERIAQLQALGRLLVEDQGVEGETIGFYVGSSTPAERDRCAGCSVILSTYQMAREGLDQKHLTALCLASPTSDLTQAVGRVQRDSGRERRGPPPLILDPCDIYSLFEHQARKRRRFFKNAGFTLQRWTASTQHTRADDGNECALFC